MRQTDLSLTHRMFLSPNNQQKILFKLKYFSFDSESD